MRCWAQHRGQQWYLLSSSHGFVPSWERLSRGRIHKQQDPERSISSFKFSFLWLLMTLSISLHLCPSFYWGFSFFLLCHGYEFFVRFRHCWTQLPMSSACSFYPGCPLWDINLLSWYEQLHQLFVLIFALLFILLRFYLRSLSPLLGHKDIFLHFLLLSLRFCFSHFVP